MQNELTAERIERAIKEIPESGMYIVEDAKGCRTKEYMLKRKMYAYRYGQEIKEV